MSAQAHEPEYNEFYCWSPDPPEGEDRTEWYVRNAANDEAVFGPTDIDTAIRESARRNARLTAKETP